MIWSTIAFSVIAHMPISYHHIKMTMVYHSRHQHHHHHELEAERDDGRLRCCFFLRTDCEGVKYRRSIQ